MSGTACLRFREDVVGLLEGTASDALREHVAGCDACRDASHELESVAASVARAGDDYALTPALADRLAELAEGDRISETRMKTDAPAPPAPPRARASRKTLWLILAACVSVAASARATAAPAGIWSKTARHRPLIAVSSAATAPARTAAAASSAAGTLATSQSPAPISTTSVEPRRRLRARSATARGPPAARTSTANGSHCGFAARQIRNHSPRA